MATRQQQADLYNQAIAQGLSPAAAEIAAGITDANVNDFAEEDGKLVPLSIKAATGVPSNWTREDDVDEDDDEEVAFQQAAQRQGSTVTTTSVRSSTTTQTGGGSTTRVVQPTVYKDTPASSAAQAKADAAAAAREAKVAQLKAEGKSTAQILRDPEVKALAAERDAAAYDASKLKAPVPGTGGVTETVEPNTTLVETEYLKSSPASTTNNAGGEDEVVQYSEVSQTPDGVAATNVYGQAQDVNPLDGDPNAAQDGDGEVAEGDIVEDPYAPDVDPYGVENEERDPTTFAENQPVQYDAFGNEIPPGSTEEGLGAFGGAGDPIESPADAENPYSTADPGVITTPPTESAEAAAARAAAEQALLSEARAQAALNERRRQANQGDWRVKLRLAPLADYLYKATDPGILQPLAVTDGVVFPYTPKIDMSYRAMYDTTAATHTNYNNYFYKGSQLDPVNISATFTAQDTAEANYMLAVIHFFRSITKMFYGQDAQRGAPPPLVFFSGLGEYQFSEHPCVIHQFNYSLPSDVDYIRARSVMDPGASLQNRRSRTSVPTSPLSFSLKRLGSLGQDISQGAEGSNISPPTLGTNSPTYVPTRIDLTLILYPIQSRAQVSKQFSVKQYANGDLLKGGFW